MEKDQTFSNEQAATPTVPPQAMILRDQELHKIFAATFYNGRQSLTVRPDFELPPWPPPPPPRAPPPQWDF